MSSSARPRPLLCASRPVAGEGPMLLPAASWLPRALACAVAADEYLARTGRL